MKDTPKEAYWMQIFILAPVYVNTLLAGCSLGWVGNALLFFLQDDEVTATLNEWSLVTAASDLGQIIFAIPSGILVDMYGRKKLIIATGFWHLISGLSLSLTTSLSIIILARFFSGIAIALGNSTTAITIGEIASPEIRGQLNSITQIFFTFGVVLQGSISILFNSYFSLSYCLLALACAFFLTLFWILETPYYLISVSKIAEARRNLESIRPGYTEEEIDFEFHSMQTYILDEKKAKHQVNWVQFLTIKSIREPLITAILIYYFVFALGLALISSYTVEIIPENDIVPLKYYPIILSIVQFVPSFSIIMYVEKFPRRTLFLMGAAVMGLLHLFLALTDYCFLELHNDLCRWMFIFGILLFMLTSKGSLEPMVTTLNSELLPQLVKGFGSSLCAMAQSAASITLISLYTFVTSKLGQYYIFVILTMNSLILFLLVYFRLPEARGRYLAELQTCPNEITPLKTKTHFEGSGDELM